MLKIFGCSIVLCAALAVAQTNPPASGTTTQQTQQQTRAQRTAELLKDYHGPKYVRSEVMIPVRDGVELHTVILRPEGSDKSGSRLPFLMQRTPYGVNGASAESAAITKPELATSGYIFVYQDIRGRYGSGGQFVMNHPIVAHNSKTDVDETTDTRDTIDWLLKNVPNNSGKVGVLGVSYPGFLAMMAGIDAHPAVKAISPQAPMTDIWRGDDFFHNGAFRETYGFDYVQQLEAQKTDVAQSSKDDQFNFFLDHVNFAGAAAAAGMTDLPTAKVFLAQPSYVKFWQDMAVEPHLSKPEVPTLEVGGYWDQEDMWGTQAEYAALRPHEDPNDPLHHVYMVLGPWNHGGWSFGPGSELMSHYGGINFGGENTGAYYRATFEAPFFEFYLKDKPGFDLKDTASFRTGENKWHRYAIWPPKQGFHEANLYLEPGPAAEPHCAERRGRGRRDLRGGSCGPDPVPAPADSVDLWAGVAVAHVAGGGSAVRLGPQGPRELRDAGAEKRRDGDRRRGGRPVRGDDGLGHRLGGEAHRCLPGRLSTDGCRRDSARALPQELHRSRASEARRGNGVQVEPARNGPHLPEGPPDDGRGAVELVSALRPQSADLGAEHHDGAGLGLQGGDPHYLRVAQIPIPLGVTAGGRGSSALTDKRIHSSFCDN